MNNVLMGIGCILLLPIMAYLNWHWYHDPNSDYQKRCRWWHEAWDEAEKQVKASKRAVRNQDRKEDDNA